MLSEENFDEPEPPDDHMSLEEEDDDDNADDNNPEDSMSLDEDDDDAIDDDNTPDEEFVELDPSGRYGRYAEVLGRGATKVVYKAYDMVDCKEVAWNKAKANTHAEGPVEEALAIEREIILLQRLNSKGIIKLYSAWVDEMSDDTNFITELCSTTLLDFRLKHKHVSRKATKSWARQILEGLVYLHTQDPPIIHRDLKCENIFVKSSSSTTLKIGDFGSATILNDTHHMHTLVGTPEFMAPEMFQQDYNELVDVYSFGMCVLELVTRECPYSECTSLAQVYKYVIGGKKPRSLLKVKDVQALQFINRCLLPACKRPSAKELLDDPFLQHKKEVSANCMKLSNAMPSLRSFTTSVPGKLLFGDPNNAPKAVPPCESKEHNRINGSSTGANAKVNTTDLVSKDATCLANGNAPQAAPPSCGRKEDKIINGSTRPHAKVNTTDLVSTKDAANIAKDASLSRGYQVVGTKENENTLRLRIRIQDSSRSSNIVFPFDLRSDTPKSVAEEMVCALDYPQSDMLTLADLISEELAVLVSISEDGLAAPTCSEKSEASIQTENSLICTASSSDTAFVESNATCSEKSEGSILTQQQTDRSLTCAASSSDTAFVESNARFAEIASETEKGCFDISALLPDAKSKEILYDDSSVTSILDASSGVSTTHEPFKESALSISSELSNNDELFPKSTASASDEKFDSSLAKRHGALHGKSSSSASHNKRLRLLVFKNFKLPKFPWRPPSEHGIQGRRPLYINALA